jgi:hypothetical protein
MYLRSTTRKKDVSNIVINDAFASLAEFPERCPLAPYTLSL